MSTNDVEQISNNRVIHQESHVYFVKFGINLPRSVNLSWLLVRILLEKIDKYRKYQINSTLGEVVTYRQLKLNFIIKFSSKRGEPW